MVNIGGMSFGTTGLTNVVFSWMKTGIFWVGILLFMCVLAIGVLYIRKRRKLDSSCTVWVDRGNGKAEQFTTTCGSFGKNSAFLGLWDYGSENIYKTKRGTVIRDVSSEDFTIRDGKKHLDVMEKPDDDKVLVPISKWKIDAESRTRIAQIAPADLREAGVDIFRKSTKEMQGNMDKIVQMVIWGGFFVIALIVIMLIIQHNNNMVDKAANILKEVSTQVSTHASSAP